MNKLISLLLLLTFCLTGCETIDTPKKDDPDDFIIWDFMCHSFPMKVIDVAGNNLFHAESPEGPWKDGPYVIYKGKRFDLKLWCPEYEVETRALPPSFLELYLMKDKEGMHYLCFGEFSPSGSYYGQPFTIYWGDGSKDEIKFDLYITWKSQREPTVHRNLYLNGKQITETAYIPIVKKI